MSKSSNEKMHRSIHWFRKGLRLHDNPSLLAACKDSSEIYPVFVLDPWFVENARVGINRWRFLVQSLKDLDDSFRKFNGRLYVVRGRPGEVFPKLIKEWKISKLTYESDTEPYAKQRDAEVDQLASKHGVEVVKMISNTIFDPDRIVAKNSGKVPLTYQQFLNVCSKLGTPAKPEPSLTEDHLKDVLLPIVSGFDTLYNAPSLEDLGKNPGDCGPCLYPGGESEALARMDKYLKRTNWICQFEKPKTEPNSLTPSTTVLSPYIKFGCLSPKTFYWKLKEIYSKGKHSKPPVSLEGQLLWREFYYTIGAHTPNYDRMKGNAICKQVPWDDNQDFLQAWKEARTGFPYIDAIMTQLKTEGWIHHLARHSVACFLTRGDLWISWEEGMNVFEEWLLDADWSLNAGNWMWLSASAFFHQYFRVYSPIAFGKKTDKTGEYIRKYVPQLKKYPEKYIYEPWKAPKEVQSAAGCIIGKDYPKPIVDHDKVREANIKKMAKAYEANKAQGEANGKSSQTETPPKKKAKLSKS